MERYLLKDEIWWAGAIDWDTRDFHGYDTARGTSYNAYLILDEKVTLVDGCREGFGPQMLRRVQGCCGRRPVDYLIINHVEPDHSGAIPWLVEPMAIADGVSQEGVECRVLKLSASPRSEAAREVLESRAFLVGTPTLNNQMFPTVGAFMTYIEGLRPKDRLTAAYGSCGWAGGGVKQVDAELRGLGLEVLDPIEVKYMPGEADLEACAELGRQVALRVKAMGE